jgi:hypothetical protein
MYQFLFNIRKLGIKFIILLPFGIVQIFCCHTKASPFVLLKDRMFLFGQIVKCAVRRLRRMREGLPDCGDRGEGGGVE